MAHKFLSDMKKEGPAGPMADEAGMDLEGMEMPEEIFVLANCSGWWDGQCGGCSWGAYTAFIDQEKAQAFIEKNERKYDYFWIVPARRQD